jgi:hypothetical protein
MTAAITADYSDTGPGNAENLSELTQQDLPEEILFKVYIKQILEYKN